MEKKLYERAEAEVIMLSKLDIITASGEDESNDIDTPELDI